MEVVDRWVGGVFGMWEIFKWVLWLDWIVSVMFLWEVFEFWGFESGIRDGFLCEV